MDVLNETSNRIVMDKRGIFYKILKKYDMLDEVKKDCIFGANDYTDVNFRDKYGYTSLINASEDGDEKIIEILLEAGSDINIKNDRKNTALILACNMGHIRTVKMLLAPPESSKMMGADVNIQGEDGDTALLSAAGRKDIVGLLLEFGADINIQDKNNDTALLLAVYRRDTETVKMLLKFGADPNIRSNTNRNFLIRLEYKDHSKNKCAYTALMWAVINEYEDIVKILLDPSSPIGADINFQNESGYTALMYASKNGYENIVGMLLTPSSSIEADIQDENGNTALIYASKNGYENIVGMLLAPMGADLNIQGESGNTASMYASKNGHEKIVGMLLAPMGADLNIQNLARHTALMYASKSGYEKIVKMLLEHGAYADIQSHSGDTALILAIVGKHGGIFFMLLTLPESSKMMGIGINLQGRNGNTALIITSYMGYENMSKMLLDAGADVDIENDDGETALTIALENKHFNIVKLLCG